MHLTVLKWIVVTIIIAKSCSGGEGHDVSQIVETVFYLNSFHGLSAVLISDTEFASVEDCFPRVFSSCLGIEYGAMNVTTLMASVAQQGHKTVVFALFSKQATAVDYMAQADTFYKQLKWTERPPWIFILIDVEVFDSKIVMPRREYGISSDVYLILLRSSSGFVTVDSMTEIYELKGKDLSRQIDLNGVTSDGKINYWKLLPKVIWRSDFHQVDIIAVHVDNPVYAYSIKYKPRNNETDKVDFAGGFVVHEYWYLRDALNFTEVASKWPTYLRQAPNGSLTGLAVPINYGLADISIGSNEFLEYRVMAPNGITYLQPTFHNKLLIFLKQPSAGSARDIYLVAFSATVWILIGLTWLLVSSSLKISLCILRKLCRSRLLYNEDADMENEAWIWTLGAMCQKGWHTTPSASSCRIIFFIGLVSGLLLYTAYCASLVSILSVDLTPIRKLEDLVTYGFGLFSDDHIPTTTLVVKFYMNSGVLPKSPPDDRNLDLSTNITRLAKSPIAVVSISDSFYQNVLRANDDPRFACATFSTVAFSRRSVLSSMFVKRGSPLREYFNYKIVTMRERGVLLRLQGHYIERTSVRCLQTDSNFDQTLSPKDLITAFALLGIGFMVAGVIFAIERLVAARMLSKRKNTTSYVSPSAMAKHERIGWLQDGSLASSAMSSLNTPTVSNIWQRRLP